MADVRNASIISRGTYAWDKLVEFCQNDHDYQTIEGFKESFDCGSGYDVAYDKDSGEIVLVDKNQSHAVETGIYKSQVGF